MENELIEALEKASQLPIHTACCGLSEGSVMHNMPIDLGACIAMKSVPSDSPGHYALIGYRAGLAKGESERARLAKDLEGVRAWGIRRDDEMQHQSDLRNRKEAENAAIRERVAELESRISEMEDNAWERNTY